MYATDEIIGNANVNSSATGAARSIVNDSPAANGRSNVPAELPVVPLPGNNQTFSESAKRFGELLAPKKTHFVRGGVVVRIAPDEAGMLAIKPVDACELMSDLEQVAKLAKVTRTPDGPIMLQTTCPESMARAIMACQNFLTALPRLKMLSRCPLLLEQADELRLVVGYDEASRILAGNQLLLDWMVVG